MSNEFLSTSWTQLFKTFYHKQLCNEDYRISRQKQHKNSFITKQMSEPAAYLFSVCSNGFPFQNLLNMSQFLYIFLPFCTFCSFAPFVLLFYSFDIFLFCSFLASYCSFFRKVAPLPSYPRIGPECYKETNGK